jgi:hypothetical protein
MGERIQKRKTRREKEKKEEENENGTREKVFRGSSLKVFTVV